MEINSNSHSVFKLEYHIVWCTKFRNKVLVNAVEVSLKQVISETCGVYGWGLKSLGIMPDHVHLVVSVPPTVALADVACTLKNISAVKLFTEFPELKVKKFWGSGLWSRETFYGMVGEVNDEVVKNYVSTQKKRG